MRVGNLQSPAGRIQEALDELLIAWAQTREQWADENARSFEEQSLQRIRDEVTLAFPAITQLAQTIGTAVRECEE